VFGYAVFTDEEGNDVHVSAADHTLGYSFEGEPRGGGIIHWKIKRGVSRLLALYADKMPLLQSA
jgi:hypothetical protein